MITRLILVSFKPEKTKRVIPKFTRGFGFGQSTKPFKGVVKTVVHCDCKQLGSLPDSIGQLTHLHTLNLSRCEQLGSLPAEIGQLTSLQTLYLSYCEQAVTSSA